MSSTSHGHINMDILLLLQQVTLYMSLEATIYFTDLHQQLQRTSLPLPFSRLRGRNGHQQAQESKARNSKDKDNDAMQTNSTLTNIKACAKLKTELLVFYLMKSTLDPG